MHYKNLLFICNHRTFFLSHRREIAEALISMDNKVSLLSGLDASNIMANSSKKEKLMRLNEFIIDARYGSMNIFHAVRIIFSTFIRVLTLRPHLIHVISVQASILSGLATLPFFWIPKVFSFSGMGILFTEHSPSFKRKVLLRILKLAMRLACNSSKVAIVVQNKNDARLVTENKVAKSHNVFLIPGSGINLSKFEEASSSCKERVVLFPARILYSKGIREFVEAVESLKPRFPHVRFIIAGAIDYVSPDAPREEEFLQMIKNSGAEWIGFQEVMLDLYMSSSIVCLPSYREGFPKALIEASAAACAIVTTDVPGCRDAVNNGQTGVLVPAGNVSELKEAIETLLTDEELRKNLGNAAKEYANQNFSVSRVVEKHLQIYNRQLRI